MSLFSLIVYSAIYSLITKDDEVLSIYSIKFKIIIELLFLIFPVPLYLRMIQTSCQKDYLGLYGESIGIESSSLLIKINCAFIKLIPRYSEIDPLKFSEIYELLTIKE